jgi:hypothetical protein
LVRYRVWFSLGAKERDRVNISYKVAKSDRSPLEEQRRRGGEKLDGIP